MLKNKIGQLIGQQLADLAGFWPKRKMNMMRLINNSIEFQATQCLESLVCNER